MSTSATSSTSEAYNEVFSRGTAGFPFDFELIDPRHPRFYMPYHYHIDHELIRIRRGGLSIQLNERSYHLGVGDYLLISDGIIHGGTPDSPDTIYDCLVFNLTQLLDAASRPNLSVLNAIIAHEIIPRELYSRASAPEICQAFESLFEATFPGRPQHGLLALGYLLIALGLIHARGLYEATGTVSGQHSRELRQTGEIFRYILKNYQHDLCLDDMASAVKMSNKYFCRFFRNLTGMRPMEYLNRFRIQCAANLLRTSDRPINIICDEVGCHDPAYFTKLFRRYAGVPPSEYRRRQD